MQEYLSVGEIARMDGVSPQSVSLLFYRRHLNCELCPIVGGRRLVPRAYVDEARRIIRQRSLDPT